MIVTVIHNSEYRATCDYCGELDTHFVARWKDVIDQMKAEGWWIRKIEDKWYHFCCEVCYLQERDNER